MTKSFESAESTPAGDSRYLSTQQVAKALGVSVSTVKRWVDENVLPAHRTLGGHRKLLMSDVIRLAREGKILDLDLGKLLPEAVPGDSIDPDPVKDQLLVALREADAENVQSLIVGWYERGHPIETLADRVIGPAMFQIGHDWATGRIEVFHEHRATQAVFAALYALSTMMRVIPGCERPVAVGGAPENDHSALPSLLARLVLIDNGWDAINLGPHTPMSAFMTSLNDLNPRLVWLSASHLFDPPTFVREYGEFFREADRRRVPVAIGGNALTESIRKQIVYTTYGDGLTQLGTFARLLHRPPAIPRRGRPAENRQ